MVTNSKTSINPEVVYNFITKVDTELSRAKRYSIFVTMSVFDLSDILSSDHDSRVIDSAELLEIVRNQVRDIDYVSYINDNQLGVLLPETSRQGAEVVVKRVAEILKASLSEKVDFSINEHIPFEIASFPDAGGAKSIKDFLNDWQKKNN